MADFYYELHESAISEWGNKYFVALGKTGDAMMAGGVKLTGHSNRIWREEDDQIRYVKNRWVSLTEPVDLKEFMWIKLSAETIKGA